MFLPLSPFMHRFMVCRTSWPLSNPPTRQLWLLTKLVMFFFFPSLQPHDTPSHQHDKFWLLEVSLHQKHLVLYHIFDSVLGQVARLHCGCSPLRHSKGYVYLFVCLFLPSPLVHVDWRLPPVTQHRIRFCSFVFQD